jgi:glycosyltransferase involved in cell wall biosynthesis
LYVSRLEPENNALGVLQAYAALKTDMPLVIVGDAPYAAEYIKTLHQAAAPGVLFTGFQFGQAYQELRSHCYLYIQASEVGGTHPALVEGMAYGNCIVANDVPEHREVLGDCGWYYRKNDFLDLVDKLALLIADPELAQHLGKLAAERARQCYDWERVVDAYEKLLAQVCGVDLGTSSLETPSLQPVTKDVA